MNISKTCPNCSKPSVASDSPFCSPRCREVDLSRWFTGVYAVPAVELDDVEMDELLAAIDTSNNTAE